MNVTKYTEISKALKLNCGFDIRQQFYFGLVFDLQKMLVNSFIETDFAVC